MELKIEKTVFEFMCTYVRRIKPNIKWKKLMTNNPGSPFFCMVTPNDIAYVLAIIKNGKELWDQAKKRQAGDPGTSPKKKGKATIQQGREKEERERYIGVEQGRAGVLLHGGEKLERGVQFQGAIFGTNQWVGELGAQGQEQEGCNKDILDEGQR